MLSRRTFLERLFTGVVISAAAPTVLRSEVVPEITVANDAIGGTYTINLDDIPPIQPVGGSIRLVIPEVGPTFRIIVTRVDKDRFEAVNAQCPHENKRIKARRSDEDFLQCEAHDSKFTFDGTYIEGPANGKNLKRYETTFDGDKILEIELDELLSVAGGQVAGRSVAIHTIGPAFGSVTFALELDRPDDVAITIFSLDGAEVARPFARTVAAGDHRVVCDLSDLSAGLYLYRCTTPAGTIGTGKIVL